jgi:hypothetical protein
LIDCGLHQGSRELDEENAGPFGFDAAGINAASLLCQLRAEMIRVMFL